MILQKKKFNIQIKSKLKYINQSINLFRFPEIYLQGCYHMDMEIVKNIIWIPSNMIKNNEQYYIQE